MSNKLCACGKNRGHVHICAEKSILKKVKRFKAKRDEATRLQLEHEKLERRRQEKLIRQITSPKDFERINTPIIDGIESINNFFKMRKFNWKKIGFGILLFLAVFAAMLFIWSTGAN